jgi:hypothetical protein
MSDSNKPAEHKFAVSGDDFIRFLREKTDEVACPACASNEWTIFSLTEPDQAYRLITPLKSAAHSSFVNMLALYCDECGYVRHHLARIVKEWVTQNPEAQGQLELDEPENDPI